VRPVRRDQVEVVLERLEADAGAEAAFIVACGGDTCQSDEDVDVEGDEEDKIDIIVCIECMAYPLECSRRR